MGKIEEKDEKPLKKRKQGGHEGKKFWAHTTFASKSKVLMACLEEYIYKSGMGKYAAQFTKTAKKLCNYMLANYKLGVDIVRALRQLRKLSHCQRAPVGTTKCYGELHAPDGPKGTHF